MDTSKLGKTGPTASAIGLGAMGMSGFYGPADRNESIATIHAALDAGITLLDTGDFYGMGHNEMLIREALAARRRDNVQISVKFGALRGPDGRGSATTPPRRGGISSPIRCSGSASITSTSTARPGSTPTCRSRRRSGAIADMIKAGYIRHIGLSEVGVETIRRAAQSASDLPICRSSIR